MIHTVKGFGIISKAEVDNFLKFCCFFCDSADAGNLIYGSSAFSKTSLNRMIFVRFQGKPFSITVIQVYAPTSNAEEAEVEQFYEDL